MNGSRHAFVRVIVASCLLACSVLSSCDDDGIGPERDPGFVLAKEIAFCSDRGGGIDIWKVSADNPDPVRLTNHQADGVCAWDLDNMAWSPDGSRLVYKSNRTGDNEIYVMNADGTGEVNITNDPDQDNSPSWSSDGSQIVFFSNRDGDKEIFVMNADGTGVTQLTDNDYKDGGPTWSPDGSKIAWFHEEGFQGGMNGISVMNPDGTGKMQLTDGLDGHPSWSPDGTKIAFQRVETGFFYVMNADGSGLTQLPGPVYFGGAWWSPDGTMIAITDLVAENDSEIFLVNVDGSGSTQLTDSPGHDLSPTWSPDGKSIAFQSDRDGAYGIFVLNTETSTLEVLVDGPSNDMAPLWKRAP